MKLVLMVCVLIITSNVFAQNKVIYGEDNRHDVYNYKDKAVAQLAASTVALIRKNTLTHDGSFYNLPYTRYQESQNLCSSERFLDQPTAAFCSGFLIAPNKIVTAGHCIESKSDCDNTAFIFNYRLATSNSVYIKFAKYYSCKRILGQQKNALDFAVIELTEEVTDVPPLTISDNIELAEGDPLFVIGHPSGLPTKISDNAHVRSIKPYDSVFKANLDTYGGNSGSAVFNARTHEVEGILVRGETDFVRTNRNCNVSNRVSDTGGRGEDVVMISYINEDGIVGTNTKLSNDKEFRYIWFSWFRTCNEFYGNTFIREVESSYCRK